MRIGRATLCLCLLIAAPAAAQIPQPTVQPSEGPGFLTHSQFWLSASALADDDPKFSWDAHFGGTADVIDYGVGRLGARIDYEAILGDELRLFDPNQGDYTLEGYASVRLGSDTEIEGIFHHVSRHLSDRPKSFPIAWNLLGARLLRHAAFGDTTVDVDVEGGAVVQHSFVDYRWGGGFDATIRRPLSPHVSWFVQTQGQLVGVAETVNNRGTQFGGLAEAGVRITGRGAILEVYAGAEQRIDAYPTILGAQQWGLAGIRLLSR